MRRSQLGKGQGWSGGRRKSQKIEKNRYKDLRWDRAWELEESSRHQCG